MIFGIVGVMEIDVVTSHVRLHHQLRTSAALALRGYVPGGDLSRCSNVSEQKLRLLDHLVGEQKERFRDREPKCLCGPEVHD
jgi:hypothetical protein